MDLVMVEAFMKAATPGENHALLKPLAGDWSAMSKVWMDPSAPPDQSNGICERHWINDGRFLVETYSGQAGGQRFDGFGITGYDNVKKKFCNVWTDSMSTGFMVSYGTYDPATKTINYIGEYEDPITNKPKKYRCAMKLLGPDKHVFEMFDTGPDGNEFRNLETTYTKK